MTNPNCRPHILLVEDDYEQRVIIGLLLEELKIDVTVLPNASEVVKFLANTPVDIIVSDWLMPGMSGLDLFDLLQAHPEFKTVPFILITAANTESTLEEYPINKQPRMICSKEHLGSQLRRQVQEIIKI
jgi:two-component system chemotaxis response regulator CheY